jgi:hypothetical protein
MAFQEGRALDVLRIVDFGLFSRSLLSPVVSGKVISALSFFQLLVGPQEYVMTSLALAATRFLRRETHLCSGFSPVDAGRFSVSNFASCSRCWSASFASGTSAK